MIYMNKLIRISKKSSWGRGHWCFWQSQVANSLKSQTGIKLIKLVNESQDTIRVFIY